MNSKQRATFAVHLAELRKKKQLTQHELANDVGIQRVTIAKYESQKRIPSYEDLTAFAKYFDTSTDYLLGLTNVARVETPEDEKKRIACDYTGLTDEAVKKIVYARSEGIYDKELDILSWLISEEYVLELCTLLLGIRINSEEYIRQLKEYEELKKLCTNQDPENIKKILKDKWLEYQLMDDNLDAVYNDVDVERYRLIKFIEALSDIFDDRKQTNGKDPDLLYMINKIKRKFDDMNLYFKFKKQ